MINQQLLDFIKQQLQKGTSKEVITNELLDNGWTGQDVTEAFGVINTPPPAPAPIPAPVVTNVNLQSNPVFNSNPVPVSNFGDIKPVRMVSVDASPKKKSFSVKKILLIVLVLFLVASGASAYFFRSDLVKLPVLKNIFPSKDVAVVNEVPAEPAKQEQNLPIIPVGSAPIDNSQNPSTQDLLTQNNGIETTNPVQVKTSDSIACKDNDMKCFIDAAKNCSPATVEFKNKSTSTEKPAPIFDITTKNNYTLLGFNEVKKCIMNIRIDDTQYALNYNYEESLKSLPSMVKGPNGVQYPINVQFQIDASKHEVEAQNEIAKISIGKTTKCLIDTQSLIQFLELIKSNDPSLNIKSLDYINSKNCTE